MRTESFQFGRPVPRWYRIGPLSGHLDAYATRLGECHYARETARHKLRIISDLSRWLARVELDIVDLDDRSIATFFQQRQRYDAKGSGDLAAVRLFLDLLRERGVLAEKPPAEGRSGRPTEIAFERYLREERRVSESAVNNSVPFIRRFLDDRFGTSPVSLGDITPTDITQFVLRVARTMSSCRAKLLVGALRSYFRFLYVCGEITADLGGAVPTVASWRLSDVPKSIEPEAVERLLMSCERRTTTGRRDYAILLLLARLGLRAGEIAALTFEDIDWDAGEILVRGKGSRYDRLPLPSDVGNALVAYLHDRPACTTRRIFLSARPPVRALARHGSVGAIVMRALTRAGIAAPNRGAHVLRHSLAVRMLRGGASLGEIGEILRHRQLNTTAIYAKVDLNALRSLAQPWPGGGA